MLMRTGTIESGSDEARWTAVQARDRQAGDAFVFAVSSTGIYCRASCPARRPRRDHVRFFADGAAARAAGFRACLRCRPDRDGQAEAAGIATACRLIEASETLPPIDRLAEAAGLSRATFARIFRQITGTSPRTYGAAHRTGQIRAAFGSGERVIDSALAAGFSGSSGFYAQAGAALGMAPARFRKGGVGEVIRYEIAATTLGPLLVAATARGLVAIEFGEDSAALVGLLEARFAAARLVGDDPAFAGTVAQVVAAVEEPRAARDLPLDIRGTAFQQRVWAALRAIPAGQSLSYGGLAEAIGAPRAVRAVAGACAANRLAVAIPCHRIIGKDGSLTGYRWGTTRKRVLLEREAETSGSSAA